MINAYIENDSATFLTKNTAKPMILKPPVAVCGRNEAHPDLSCSSCHSSWAPTCIGCHNTYDENELGYDMMRNVEVKGSWVEYIGEYNAKQPALGIRTDGERREVIPVIPGMVLTIDRASYTHQKGDSVIFHRLYAPVAPHTTGAKGRDCKSCHNNPVALGYGEGDLNYMVKNGKGQWLFIPRYTDDPRDGLPADAWTGFLSSRTGIVATRTNVSPFNVETQKKILTVGACLTCHDQDSKLMLRSLTNYPELLRRLSPECLLPEWYQGDL